MLNNNFSKLIKLYEKYQKKQRMKMLIKLLGIILLLTIVYLIYLQQRTSQDTTTAPASELNNTSVTTTAAEQKEIDKKEEEHTQPVQRTKVDTPKEENMPKQVQKRTPSDNKTTEQPMQLQMTQREGLYKMLVDYKDNKSYVTAIKIAQFYLLQKEYEKAVKWAVEASKKDPSQAQSWIIYAKAKKALGKPEVAKRALSIYLKHNHSQEAKALLNSL